MPELKIAFMGAGSPFAAGLVVDLLLSETLREWESTVVLVDTNRAAAEGTCLFAERAAQRVGVREHSFEFTTDRGEALDGADFVLCAVERDRMKTWRQDYNIPLRHGVKQALGECAGPGALFHFLRNLVVVLEIAREMEKRCPSAPMLTFTNPENRLPFAINTFTGVKTYGFCHGVFIGARKIAALLGRPAESLSYSAAGLNHFTWFTRLEDKETGRDLYPELRQKDREHPLEQGPVLDRIAFRRFGLWPSPGGNHIAEYLAWAGDFEPKQPWLIEDQLHAEAPKSWYPDPDSAAHRAEHLVEGRGGWEKVIRPSGELPIPMIEGLVGGAPRRLEAVIHTNAGAISNLPADAAVEAPAKAHAGGVELERIGDLPEAIAAMCRTQISIHKIGLEAFRTRSKDLLIQAVLIDPVVTSYDGAIAMVEEFLRVQREYLPEFR